MQLFQDVTACIAAWTRAAEVVTCAALAARDAYLAVKQSSDDATEETAPAVRFVRREHAVFIRNGGQA